MMSQGYVRFTLNGTRAETPWLSERRPASEPRAWLVREGELVCMGVPAPLQRAAMYVDPSGTFVTGGPGEYLLRVTRNGRDTAMLFGRPHTPVVVRAVEKPVAFSKTHAVVIVEGDDDRPRIRFYHMPAR
jgi:hypothetical protein